MEKIHNIYQAPFINEMIEVTQNLWHNGWAERNGGNISYMIPKDEVKYYLNLDCAFKKTKLSFSCPSLNGKIFLVSGSGMYFKNIKANPAQNLALIRICDQGCAYELIWGLENGGNPTSELASHLKCHETRLKIDINHRVILHTHSIAVSAMTFVHDLDEYKFSKTLWQMITECLIVFPDGVGILPWMVAGTNELGEASALKMQETRIVIWPHHGIMAAGTTMDDAFGLIETAEKAALIYLKASSVPSGIIQRISVEQLKDLAVAFNVVPRVGILES
ncbi:MAG: rhamnulose-1-phosphate aldolase [Bacilli bacterium]